MYCLSFPLLRRKRRRIPSHALLSLNPRQIIVPGNNISHQGTLIDHNIRWDRNSRRNSREGEKKFRPAGRPGQRDWSIFGKIAPTGGFEGGQQGPQGDQAQRAGHKEGPCVYWKAGPGEETCRSPGLDAGQDLEAERKEGGCGEGRDDLKLFFYRFDPDPIDIIFK